ncbi:MAG: nucleotidyltransferase domain-containing protein [Lachnospiraceae bacterium]|nr:nucleotidyltransferase domain-containing protein [Lachnospiraceae bacterium]
MINIEEWMEVYQRTVLEAFGSRVLFIGIQGSYARGEATDRSDIDVVFILDKMEFADLETYREITDGLPHRDLLCGFVAGSKELEGWDKADLFQFFFDTKSVYGQLENLIAIPTENDARKAVSVGACNLYHACSHNYLHAKSPEVLVSLYKSARFVLQAAYFCESGRYAAHYHELKECLKEKEKTILETAMQAEQINEKTFDKFSQLLLEWASDLICRFYKQMNMVTLRK